MSLTATIILVSIVMLAVAGYSFCLFSALQTEAIEEEAYDKARSFERYAVRMIRKGNATEVVIPRDVSIRSLRKVMTTNRYFVLAEDEHYRKVVRHAE